MRGAQDLSRLQAPLRVRGRPLLAQSQRLRAGRLPHLRRLLLQPAPVRLPAEYHRSQLPPFQEPLPPPHVRAPRRLPGLLPPALLPPDQGRDRQVRSGLRGVLLGQRDRPDLQLRHPVRVAEAVPVGPGDRLPLQRPEDPVRLRVQEQRRVLRREAQLQVRQGVPQRHCGIQRAVHGLPLQLPGLPARRLQPHVLRVHHLQGGLPTGEGPVREVLPRQLRDVGGLGGVPQVQRRQVRGLLERPGRVPQVQPPDHPRKRDL